MITVILTCYKRTQHLQKQISAIESQTIKPADIWIWYNAPEDREQEDLRKLVKGNYKIIQSNHNFKFHARFSLALLARTEYVALFDDDTIPAPQWFENCMNTMKQKGNAILVTSGVLLRTNTSYRNCKKIGWNGQRGEGIIPVDLGGHAWFMRKDTIRHMFSKEPYSWDNGEDIQLSFLAYMKAGIETFVPPHPRHNHEVWGSTMGKELGGGRNASCRQRGHYDIRNNLVKKYVNEGYVICKDRIR